MAAVRAKTDPRILGLTGPIACGKSTVGDVLLELGAIDRIDADHVVHRLMAPGGRAISDVVAAFGPSVLATDGGIDRERLAALVFADVAALQRLEAILHPAVRADIRRQVAKLEGRQGIVIIDAVKLLQSDLLPLCESVWVVSCRAELQMQRLTENRGMQEDAARARLRAQPDFKHPAVTAVIDNSGTLEQLRVRVAEQWARFGSNHRQT